MPTTTRTRQATVWLTPREAAAHARLSMSLISRAANDGSLTGYKTDPGNPRSHWRFKEADVDKWLERGLVKVRRTA